MTADADLAAVLSPKRNGIILHTLATRPARFGELHTAISAISTRMLAGRLRDLVDAGLGTHDRLPPGPASYTFTPWLGPAARTGADPPLMAAGRPGHHQPPHPHRSPHPKD